MIGALLPGVTLFLSSLLLGKSTIAWLLADCRAPVPGAPTRALAVDLPCPAPLPLPTPESRRYAPFALPLFPRGIPGAPGHTLEASPASRSVAPLPRATPPVAAGFCRRGKRLRPGRPSIRRQVRYRRLLSPPTCIHQQRQ